MMCISTELSSTAQRKSRLADLRLIGMCMVEMVRFELTCQRFPRVDLRLV